MGYKGAEMKTIVWPSHIKLTYLPSDEWEIVTDFGGDVSVEALLEAINKEGAE